MKQIKCSSEAIDRVIEYLRPIQLEQTHSLSEILDRQFTEWKTLFGTKRV